MNTTRSLLGSVVAARAIRRFSTWGLFCPLLVACSQEIPGKPCAAPKAFVTDKATTLAAIAKDKEKWGIPDHGSGGFIDLLTYEAPNGDLDSEPRMKTRRCAAYLTFATSGPGEELPKEVRIWTADHCVRPSVDKSLSFQIYAEGGYTTLPMTIELLTLAAAARADSVQLPVAARERFLKAFDTHTTQLTAQGVARCQELTLAAGEAKESDLACFSMADLTTFVAALPESLTPEQGVALRMAFESHKKLRTVYMPGFLKGQGVGVSVLEAGEKVFTDAFDSLVKARRQESVSVFARELARCADPAVTEAICAAGALARVTDLHQKYFASQMFEQEGLPVSATPPTALEDLAQGAPAALVAEKLISAAWRIIKTPVFNKLGFIFQSNVVMGAEAGAPPTYRWLPSFRAYVDSMQTPGAEEVAVSVFDDAPPVQRALLFRIHKSKSPYRFEAGDSGTIVDWGAFPLGALSTVNGVPTEGAVLTVLPKSQRGARERPGAGEFATQDGEESQDAAKADKGNTVAQASSDGSASALPCGR